MTGLGIIFALLFVGGMVDLQRRPHAIENSVFVVACMAAALIFGLAGAR